MGECLECSAKAKILEFESPWVIYKQILITIITYHLTYNKESKIQNGGMCPKSLSESSFPLLYIIRSKNFVYLKSSRTATKKWVF